jgi:Mor family transcriptional regulator
MPPLNLKMRQKIAQLRADGLKTDVIAHLTGLTVQAVCAYERRMGVIKRKRGRPASAELAERDKAIYEACQRGYSYETLAKKYGIKKDYVRMIKLREAERRQQRQVTLSAHA